MLGDVLGYFGKDHFLIKHSCGSFVGKVWGKFGYFFLTSDHTVRHLETVSKNFVRKF